MEDINKETNLLYQKLETERLILRQLNMDDKDFIFKQFSDAEVCRYFDEEPFTTLEQATELIDWYARPDKDPWRRWGIVKKDDGVMIGTCGYHKWDQRHMRVEIGYDLYKDHWNHGYMREAVEKLIHFCFTILGVNRIDALTHPENSRSINVLTKSGFKEEGILREYVFHGGKFDDQLSLSLLKREWSFKDSNSLQKPKVAFICVHNSCRSQIAEALGKHLASDVFDSYSAGTETKPRINQDAVRLMKQIYGIDMEKTQFSKLLEDIPHVDVVVTMGCNVECPFLPCSHREDWGLEDPTGKGDDEFVKVISRIEENIKRLAEKLSRSGPA